MNILSFPHCFLSWYNYIYTCIYIKTCITSLPSMISQLIELIHTTVTFFQFNFIFFIHRTNGNFRLFIYISLDFSCFCTLKRDLFSIYLLIIHNCLLTFIWKLLMFIDLYIYFEWRGGNRVHIICVYKKKRI